MPCNTTAHGIWGHLWYFERTVHRRYIPSAQHSYDYDRVGLACKGRVGGEAQGKIDVEALTSCRPAPSVGWKTRSILLLYVLSTCQGGKGLVNSHSTNSVDLNTTAPPTYPVTWQWSSCYPPQHWFIKQLTSLLNYCLFDNTAAKEDVYKMTVMTMWVARKETGL
jgi:hypothetical protein